MVFICSENVQSAKRQEKKFQERISRFSARFQPSPRTPYGFYAFAKC